MAQRSTMHSRRLRQVSALVVVLVLGSLVGGCGQTESRQPQELDASVHRSNTTDTETAADPADDIYQSPVGTVCDLLTAEDLQKIVGRTFLSGEPGTGSFRDVSCAWATSRCPQLGESVPHPLCARFSIDFVPVSPNPCEHISDNPTEQTYQPVPSAGDFAYLFAGTQAVWMGEGVCLLIQSAIAPPDSSLQVNALTDILELINRRATPRIQ